MTLTAEHAMVILHSIGLPSLKAEHPVTRRVAAIPQVALNHSIHHRGQLSMYLRPMGAAVPSIYGERYDAREARERAERQAAAQG
jgi:uncharacterized damage-inducible protein DinB